MSPSAIIAGIATGLVLGLFGSGGSIITTPALLYLLHVEPKSAIAMSLGIVAVTATLAAAHHYRQGHVNLKVTAVFGAFGIIGTYAGARLGVITPAAIQLGVFALVMYAASWRMLRPARPRSGSVGAAAAEAVSTREIRYGHVALHGVAVGALTGLVGVGGGFLIVPALVLLSGLTMKQAVGTSLAVVAIKSYAGFVGYAGEVPIDFELMAVFIGVAVAGSFVGNWIGNRLPSSMLQKAFAVFLLLVATYILYDQAAVQLLS